ncbi:MAG TPA: (2Fe-2S)-binding protein [Anaerolineales bacterium]|nr:(2Fe-2S)-binding protein [Anaerolineales bacterium]
MTIRTISFTLNGQAVTVQAPVAINLLTLLREYMDITSPKFGCAQGNCGACTVLLDGEPVNSCMVLAPTIEGRKVTTVEGVGTPQKPHPLQLAITEHYGAQCGFCTPGMIMSGVALLNKNSHPSRDEVVAAITGNVCRCTGYKKIVESVLAAAESMR